MYKAILLGAVVFTFLLGATGLLVWAMPDVEEWRWMVSTRTSLAAPPSSGKASATAVSGKAAIEGRTSASVSGKTALQGSAKKGSVSK